MKVLVSDPISEQGIEILSKEVDVDIATGLEPSELIKRIGDYEALIVRSETQVTKDVINTGKKLKIIGRAGVGVDNIDVNAATERGIIVVNAPEGNTISAAEHTIAMMMALSRNIPQANASLKGKKWDRKRFMGVEVRDKILGVIGLGRIGTEVARRAAGMEMKILAYDPFISPERAEELGVELTTVEGIVKRADYITVHTPLTKETKNLISDREFAIMKKGARLVNCARGGIINEEALAKAVRDGIVSGAAIDVFTKEPPFDNPLLELDSVIVTPHLGASTEEAQINVAVTVAEQVINALKGLPVKNAINMPYVKPDVMQILEPYLPLAEKLGKLCTQLMGSNYEKIEVSYCGEIADQNVAPLTLAVLKGLLEPVLGPGVNYVNAPGIAKERKIKVIESKSETVDGYPSQISVRLSKKGDEKLVNGTILGKEPRIIKIDTYRIDVVPTGYMIVAKHEDRPNIIGPCCMILGRNNINIAGMQVGRIAIGGEAIMVLNIDCDVSDGILDEIRSINGIIDAKRVVL
ncbi:D-3-phosphoglycerate dehydrogenase [Candidatus Methanoperedens nitroreducens]|uniref:D-3-phosphoglycerate dehydrogenase n=1 Tax=Candidatus Methanoperedens nitratireducens TaxID=1392998 RepID=A0A062VCL9_9EURY|nr:phosphoglycerate dehydrogenase [Candidatus Methanoperedens nitroreducens]KCZ72990.1 D-3-phosphoglycerate dehydrogenase [Candidatus Methanoperedens nitroreducens]MDJ1423066.1 phosphoglycerate dehydrogenase [Candidatus Methanoperedens sp.]